MGEKKAYDCMIVGGGPAGLSAAIYMGRFLRKTIVLDAESGRSTFDQVNDNYLGFPEGIQVKELRDLGRQQAERFGVKFQKCSVDSLSRHENVFVAKTARGEVHAKTVILCTGVCDIWPDVPDVLDFVGRSLFWCITCDGFRTVDKRVVLFGGDDDAATTACQFQVYTKHLTLVHAPGELDCSEDNCRDLVSHGIKLVEGEPERVEGSRDKIKAVILKGGKRLPADLMFSLLGVTTNNKLALDLGVNCDNQGYVVVDQENYTNVPGVFAAGDLTKKHSHQVVSAAHEGAEAGQTANYYLYAQYQKLESEDRT